MNSLSLLCLIPFVTGAPGHFEKVKAFIDNANANAFSIDGSSFGNDDSFAASASSNLKSEDTISARNGKAFPFQSSSFTATKNLRSGDIIADTRALSNQVQTTLRQLASDPASAAIINRIINDKDNICLSNLEEGIAGIEAATK